MGKDATSSTLNTVAWSVHWNKVKQNELKKQAANTADKKKKKGEKNKWSQSNSRETKQDVEDFERQETNIRKKTITIIS